MTSTAASAENTHIPARKSLASVVIYSDADALWYEWASPAAIEPTSGLSIASGLASM